MRDRAINICRIWEYIKCMFKFLWLCHGFASGALIVNNTREARLATCKSKCSRQLGSTQMNSLISTSTERVRFQVWMLSIRSNHDIVRNTYTVIPYTLENILQSNITTFSEERVCYPSSIHQRDLCPLFENALLIY